MTPHEQAAALTASYAAYLTETRARALSPHPHVWASSWRACDRRMYLDCTEPGQALAPDAELLAKFEHGRDRERDQIATLLRVGRNADPPFEIIAQQERFELRARSGRVAISGRIDGRLVINGARPPFEIKAWSPFLVERIERFDDVIENPFTRGGAYQLLSYLLGVGEPYGFLILDRSGLPKILDVELAPNLDRAEHFLARAERVIAAVERDEPPPYINDPDECHRCPYYGHACNPPEATPAPIVLTDPALEAALERRHAIEKIGREYADLDAEIKQRLRGVERGYCGPFELVGTWGRQSKLELPDDVRKRYTTTIERGRFTLTITKH